MTKKFMFGKKCQKMSKKSLSSKTNVDNVRILPKYRKGRFLAKSINFLSKTSEKSTFGQKCRKMSRSWFLVKSAKKPIFWSKMPQKLIFGQKCRKSQFWWKKSIKSISGKKFRKISKKLISDHNWNTCHNIYPLQIFDYVLHCKDHGPESNSVYKVY